jgi:ketosteroid isomerase-like protein
MTTKRKTNSRKTNLRKTDQHQPSKTKTVPGTHRATKTRAPSDKAQVLGAALMLANAIRRGKTETAKEYLSRDFTFIDASGRLHSRRDVLGNLQPGPTLADMKETVRAYGQVALITGSLKSGQAQDRKDLFALDVWVKSKDGWQALIHHDNVLAPKAAPRAHPPSQARSDDAPPPECRNPLKVVPYEPASQAERDVIKAFQRMEKAVTENDAREWVQHVADEFVVYRTGQHPTTKAGRVAFIRSQAAINAETWVAEIARMKLWVLGDAAVMRADHKMPGDRRPPYRATRLWIKREGRWQMAVSQQTTIVT